MTTTIHSYQISETAVTIDGEREGVRETVTLLVGRAKQIRSREGNPARLQKLLSILWYANNTSGRTKMEADLENEGTFSEQSPFDFSSVGIDLP